MLEPDAGKLARPVLRRGSDGNAAPLPDRQRHREAVMRKKIGFLLLGVLIIGCWYFWSAYRHLTPEAIVHGVGVGMSEGQVRSALKAVALDSGTVYWGGSGARRLYFELPPQRQVWVECAGASGGWKVVEVGRIEPKQRWVRHSGDAITVE